MFDGNRRPERGLLRTIVIGIFVLALPIALVTTVIRVTISEQAVYDYGVRNYNAERTTGIPESELIRANGDIRDYLVRDKTPPLAPQVTNSDGERVSLFNAKEISHMADVRSLVQFMFTVQMIALAIALALIVVMIVLWPTRVFAAASLWAGIVMTSGLAVVGALAVTGFDAAWSQFHQIAFTNDLWQLNPRTDHLIQMYPEAFWQDVSMALGSVLLTIGLGLIALSGTYLYLTRNEVIAVEPELPPQRDYIQRTGVPHRPQLSPPNPRHYVR
jgi:integral membrane protein (TIGR01906 family)